MSMVIISGRNGGYPCIAEIGEAVFAAPFPKTLFMLSGDDYPEIRSVESARFSAPYPDCLMRIFGSTVNDGYPCISSVSGVERVFRCDIRFNEKNILAMYFGGKKLKTGYCNGQVVLTDRFEVKTDN